MKKQDGLRGRSQHLVRGVIINPGEVSVSELLVPFVTSYNHTTMCTHFLKSRASESSKGWTLISGQFIDKIEKQIEKMNIKDNII